MNDSLRKLVKKYGQQQNLHPFLLVDLSGGKENTHTSILMSLLRFQNYMFFGSFLSEVLNVPEWDGDTDSVVISTQLRAVGLKVTKKSKGFIDLYIKYHEKGNNEEQIIVIENKINGATDTPKQLLRYIASVKKTIIDKNDDFEKWVIYSIEPSRNDANLKEEIKNDCLNRHLIYLTLDNSKEPEEDSLPSFLREDEIIEYDSISYQDNILQWLQGTVLRSCPYLDDGIVIAGLRQYIASLEGLLNNTITISDIVHKYVQDQTLAKKTIISSYYDLIQSIKDLEDYTSSLSNDLEIENCNRLARELRKAAEELITKDSVPDGWILHIAPTLLVLYREEWMKIARGSYSIPFVSLFANPKTFLNGTQTNWTLHIEHFSPQKWNEMPDKQKFRPTNHNRTAVYDLELNTTFHTQDAAGRKKCVDDVISKASGIIHIIDDAVRFVDGKKTNWTNDKEIRVELFEQLAKNLPPKTPFIGF